jgi:predicted RNA-binding protein YlxR (DUF448 family)
VSVSGPDPVRTCVGCGTRAPKRELLRVAVADGEPAPDPHGRAPGRGAYVHRREACVDQALRRGALARALRIVARGPHEGGAARLREAVRPSAKADADEREHDEGR